MFFFLGDSDENLYIIQSGKVNVFITGADGSTISLKCVKTGESVTSLLSFTDVLTVSKSTRGKLFLSNGVRTHFPVGRGLYRTECPSTFCPKVKCVFPM